MSGAIRQRQATLGEGGIDLTFLEHAQTLFGAMRRHQLEGYPMLFEEITILLADNIGCGVGLPCRHRDRMRWQWTHQMDKHNQYQQCR